MQDKNTTFLLHTMQPRFSLFQLYQQSSKKQEGFAFFPRNLARLLKINSFSPASSLHWYYNANR